MSGLSSQRQQCSISDGSRSFAIRPLPTLGAATTGRSTAAGISQIRRPSISRRASQAKNPASGRAIASIVILIE